MSRWLICAVLVLGGCVQGVTQVAGTGSVYTTRCSAEMEVRGVEYFARCTPESCESTYHSSAVSHVVVAIDPGRKLVGYAERVCVQDLSEASALFQPALEEATTTTPEEEGAPE
jgi:hypothetical protein